MLERPDARRPHRKARAPWWLAALLLLASACTPSQSPVRIGSPSFASGLARIDILLDAGFVPGSLSISLDGTPVTASFTPTLWGVSGSVPFTPGASATLAASARFVRNGAEETHADSRTYLAPVPAPALLSSMPAAGATDVPRTAWLKLVFAAPVAAATRTDFHLYCGGGGEPWSERTIRVDALEPAVLIVNPAGELPANANCGLSWQGEAGLDALLFATASQGSPAVVRYDRTQARPLLPYPDDHYLTNDSSTATGVRLAVPTIPGPADVQFIFDTLRSGTNHLDGFSPIAHFVLELSDAPDPS
jgi:hypothetical protein